MSTLRTLPTRFENREAIAAQVAALCPWLEETAQSSPFAGGRAAAEAQLAQMNALRYGKSRNFLNGAVTRLSPYIRHGILTLQEVKDAARAQASTSQEIEKLIQELTWRVFWQAIYAQHPDWIWHSVEPYKTGFREEEYAPTLPDDIARAETNVACINQFITQLYETGYLHNHARMYLAAYAVHWRRVSWQTGARWFLQHLIDADPASNNLSWQWVASTFSRKPYIFNLENVTKYADKTINCRPQDNQPLDASYEALSARLFPHRQEES